MVINIYEELHYLTHSTLEYERDSIKLWFMPRVISMSPFRREMILKVADGESRVLPLMHALTAWSLCDRMLCWLYDNKMTGRNLLSWFYTEWDGNRTLDMYKFVEMKVLGLEKPRPAIYGKNWMG